MTNKEMTSAFHDEMMNKIPCVLLHLLLIPIRLGSAANLDVAAGWRAGRRAAIELRVGAVGQSGQMCRQLAEVLQHGSLPSRGRCGWLTI